MRPRILAGLLAALAVLGLHVTEPHQTPRAPAAAASPGRFITAEMAALRAPHVPVRPTLAAGPHHAVKKPQSHAQPRHRYTQVSAPSATAWANQSFSIQVANCESANLKNWPHSDGTKYIGNAHLRDSNGHYGKWQFAPATWRSVGGHGNPAGASESEQDYRAYVLWKRDGWGQWSCSRLV